MKLTATTSRTSNCTVVGERLLGDDPLKGWLVLSRSSTCTRFKQSFHFFGIHIEILVKFLTAQVGEQIRPSVEAGTSQFIKFCCTVCNGENSG